MGVCCIVFDIDGMLFEFLMNFLNIEINKQMKLTGRWFPQILDRDSGNLYPIYIYNKNCGVSF